MNRHAIVECSIRLKNAIGAGSLQNTTTWFTTSRRTIISLVSRAKWSARSVETNRSFCGVNLWKRKMGFEE